MADIPEQTKKSYFLIDTEVEGADVPGIHEMMKAMKVCGVEKQWEQLDRIFQIIAYADSMTFHEGLKRAGRDLTREGLIEATETIQNFTAKGLAGPLSYSPKSHKGRTQGRLFKIDPNIKRYVPVTDWLKPSITREITH